MPNLDQIIRERRSVRGFFADRPIPREIINEALELAQRAPSNCNVQPWRVFIASGPARDRLRTALCEAAMSGQLPDAEDALDVFEGSYRRLQVDCAVTMYREMGVARDDFEGRMRAALRNFELFDAPHVAIICMQKKFGVRVALDVGAYVQTLLLALWSRGVASCAQASLSTYPTLIRRELSIPDDLRILCGISFGYEDESVPANRTRQTRDPVAANASFIDA
ncbi:MAG TPA: nitroreductase [Pirellulales bacterium]|nr:nitroreductase [Pirellulales bacterium]